MGIGPLEHGLFRYNTIHQINLLILTLRTDNTVGFYPEILKKKKRRQLILNHFISTVIFDWDKAKYNSTPALFLWSHPHPRAGEPIPRNCFVRHPMLNITSVARSRIWRRRMEVTCYCKPTAFNSKVRENDVSYATYITNHNYHHHHHHHLNRRYTLKYKYPILIKRKKSFEDFKYIYI